MSAVDEDCRECEHYQQCYPKIDMGDRVLSPVFKHLKAMRTRQLCVFNDKCNYKKKD